MQEKEYVSNEEPGQLGEDRTDHQGVSQEDVNQFLGKSSEENEQTWGEYFGSWGGWLGDRWEGAKELFTSGDIEEAEEGDDPEPVRWCC